MTFKVYDGFLNSFEQAKQFCSFYGARLPVIHNKIEQFLETVDMSMKNKNRTKSHIYYVGTTCSKHGYTWFDGVKFYEDFISLNTTEDSKCMCIFIKPLSIYEYSYELKNCYTPANVACDFSTEPLHIELSDDMEYELLLKNKKNGPSLNEMGVFKNPWISSTFIRRSYVTDVKVIHSRSNNLRVWVTDDIVAGSDIAHNIDGNECKFIYSSKYSSLYALSFVCNSVGKHVIARTTGEFDKNFKKKICQWFHIQIRIGFYLNMNIYVKMNA